MVTINNQCGPVAIGAVGGSGTRVVAQLLRDAGRHIGYDLNAANDNLWFTLLFKRPDILIETSDSFRRLVDIYYAAMIGQPLDERATRVITRQALLLRPQHKTEWLKERATTMASPSVARPAGPWGWKEPNTHVVIDRLLALDPMLRYIHVVRNGLDMAYSSNQNQLRFWGPIFLRREIAVTPRDSLAFWCAVHRRMQTISSQFAGRVLFLSYERICADPCSAAADLMTFIGAPRTQEIVDRFADSVVLPASIGRWRNHKLDVFDRSDIKYAATWGYGPSPTGAVRNTTSSGTA